MIPGIMKGVIFFLHKVTNCAFKFFGFLPKSPAIIVDFLTSKNTVEVINIQLYSSAVVRLYRYSTAVPR
jgi:hypothetical protein